MRFIRILQERCAKNLRLMASPVYPYDTGRVKLLRLLVLSTQVFVSTHLIERFTTCFNNFPSFLNH